MYDYRAGLLAAGLTALLPFFLLKFQGGDAQIVPYSIFALFFFLSMLYMALKRESMVFTILCGISYGTIILGSNIDILITFCLSVFFFLMGLRHVSKPDQKALKQMAIILGSILLFQVIGLAYSGTIDLKSSLEGLFMNGAAPVLAFAFPLGVDWLMERYAPKTGAMTRIGAVIGATVLVCLVLPFLPIFAQFMSGYAAWGAYVQPLTRTIAEQAPGTASYDDTMGFIAMQLNGSGAAGLLVSLIGIINAIPTIIFNFMFNSAAVVLNMVISFTSGQPGNFPTIDRTDSMMTLFFFWAILMLIVSFIRYDVDVFGVGDAQQHNRQIAGNPLWPQAGLCAAAAHDRIRGRAEGRRRIDHMSGKPLKQPCLARRHAEMVELHLRLGPRQHRGARKRRGVAMLVDAIEQCGATGGGDGPERHANGGAGRNADAAADRKDRVEDGADRVRQRPAVGHGDGRANAAAATEEPRPVGFKFGGANRLAVDDAQMRGPDFRLGRRPSAPRRQNCAGVGEIFRLDEQF